jgi:hypothetical protein
MNRIKEALAHISLPDFYKVQYTFNKAAAGFDVSVETKKTLEEARVLERIKPGETVAISASSREIDKLALILRTLAGILRDRGAKPFIAAAMGSHGGASAEGQRLIMENYGITEKAMGCPCHSGMEVILLGKTGGGLPVYLDSSAAKADHLLPVGRIKAHPDFRGPIESGLMKMLTIGFGKQFGASLCHQRGWAKMAETVSDVAEWIIGHRSVPFGLGIIEDALHRAAKIEAVPGELIPSREPELLKLAKSYIPGLPFKKIDILFVDEIGKDISGAGMDPGVTGRSAVLGTAAPFIDRIGVLNLSVNSKHNAAGIGNADVITRRLFAQIDFPATYINIITSHDPKGGMIPPFMPDDKSVFQYCLESDTGIINKSDARIVWIHNTASLDEFFISPSLLEEAGGNPALRASKERRTIIFDGQDNFLKWSGNFSF